MGKRLCQWVPASLHKLDGYAYQRAVYSVSNHCTFFFTMSSLSKQPHEIELYLKYCLEAHFIRFLRLHQTIINHRLQVSCTAQHNDMKDPFAKDIKSALESGCLSTHTYGRPEMISKSVEFAQFRACGAPGFHFPGTECDSVHTSFTKNWCKFAPWPFSRLEQQLS